MIATATKTRLTTHKIPAAFLDEFIRNRVIFIKGRIRLMCVLTASIFFSLVLLGFIINPSEFRPEELSVWAAVLMGSIIIYFYAYRADTKRSAKIIALSFVAILLLCLTHLNIIYFEYVNITPALYMFLLFLVVFTIPWDTMEVIPIAAMHIAAYSFMFFYIRGHLNTPEIRDDLDTARYIDGAVLLVMSLALSLVIRKKDSAREVENFVLLKEVEAKNTQMRRELELATRIHKTLIPHSVSTDMVDIAVMYLPMYYMGGDYAKFHFIDKEKLLFIIADVTGHGVSAALLVNRLHTEFESLSREYEEPGILLNKLNEFITKDFGEINMFLSAFCGILDFKNMKLIYSNHGHPTQYIYRITKSDIQRLTSQASLLGLPIVDTDVYQHEIDFSRGDKMLLFTDGVIENKDSSGEAYGEIRLEGFIKKSHSLGADQINQKLLDELNSFRGQTFEDDIFILSIHVK